MRSVKEMTAGVGSIIGNGKTTKILDSVWQEMGRFPAMPIIRTPSYQNLCG